jgi:type I restriction enzyme S subunit
MAKLGDVAEFFRGITFKPEDVVPNDTGGSVRCMRTKNVQEVIDLSDVWSVDQQFVRRSDQYLQLGDVLVSSANSWNLVGKCSWVPQLEWSATFGGFISVLRADPTQVNPRYLYYWFSSRRVQETVRGFGRQTTNISNLDFARCLDMRIPLPPLSGQRVIVEQLDHVGALHDKRRHACSMLNELDRSIFLDMFGEPVLNPMGWEKKPLPEVCYCYSGGTPSKSRPEFWGGYVPWFSPKDLKADDLFDSLDHINDDALSGTNLRLLPENTVAIVVRGMILSHTFPVSVLRVPATVNQDLKALLPKVDIEPEFLAACLRNQSAHALNQISTSAHGTCRLDAGGLGKIEVMLPPIELQGKFSTRTAKLDVQKKAYEAHLTSLGALFASLQHQAFDREL